MIKMMMKFLTVIFFMLCSNMSMAEFVSEIKYAELQDINISDGTVTFENTVYKYKVNKTHTQYSDSEIKPLTLRSLFKNKKYYFEIEQIDSLSSKNKLNVLFIAEEKLPE
ncbi:hypothetical protein [Marinicella gelatinilytica]|uniref:hypothetical protein n=1 Tax=Marinicella gelatinilytica TaxID=2996017 RepID=UPI0022608AEB|nr:hypothetical protein [Marinicella gelatinilytica]MCX7544580.1 hypothetical protein [Marinicella gelatinilytica]